MSNAIDLKAYLDRWAAGDPTRSNVADVVARMAEAGSRIARVVGMGALAGPLAEPTGKKNGVHVQKQIDLISNGLVLSALKGAPVAAVASEELEEAVACDRSASLIVAVDPLDGSANIDTNASVGTIFSVLPSAPERANGTDCPRFLQPGVNQLAAGMFILVHGTATMLRTIGHLPAAAPSPTGVTPGFVDLLPWAVSPFFLAIAICWLARLPHWPALFGARGDAWERVFDGLAICLVMLLAQVTAISLHLGLETSFAPMFKARIAEAGNMLFVLFRLNPSLLIGFLVGAVVVKDVRRAAHSQLTDPKALRAYAQTEEKAGDLVGDGTGIAQLRSQLATHGGSP